MGLTTSLPMKVKIYRMRKRLVMPNKAIRTEWQDTGKTWKTSKRVIG